MEGVIAMRKLLVFITVMMGFAVLFSLSAAADETSSDVSGASSSVGGLSDDDVNKIVDGLNGKDDGTLKGSVEGSIDELTKGNGWAMDLLVASIMQKDPNMFQAAADSATKAILAVMRPVGYLMLLISICFTLAKKSVALELYEAKEFVGIGVSVLFGMLLMGLCDQILILIIKACDGLTANVVVMAGADPHVQMVGALQSWDTYKSGIPIVGGIIQFISFITGNLPFLGYNLLFSVVAFIVNVILCIRVVRLAFYRGISPAFFALSIGESTRKYFESFIVTFIKVSAQMLAMGVFFVIFQITYSKVIVGSVLSLTAGMLVLIAFAVMMIKSDKYLDRILPSR